MKRHCLQDWTRFVKTFSRTLKQSIELQLPLQRHHCREEGGEGEEGEEGENEASRGALRRLDRYLHTHTHTHTHTQIPTIHIGTGATAGRRGGVGRMGRRGGRGRTGRTYDRVCRCKEMPLVSRSFQRESVFQETMEETRW
jgi:hypothetical protein